MARRTKEQRRSDRKERRESNSPREGSVAANRSAGTNKAAGGPGKSTSSSGASNQSQALERARTRNQRILQSGESGRSNKFDKYDIQAVKDKGWSDEKVVKFANRIDRNQQTGASQRATGYSGATQTDGDIKKYDPSSIGNKNNQKYGIHDVRALKGQGYSKNDIGKHFYELGDDANLGARAQKLKDKYVKSLTKPAPETQPKPNTVATAQQPTSQQTNTVSFGSGSMPVSTPSIQAPPPISIGGSNGGGSGLSPYDFIPTVNPSQSANLTQQIAQDNDITTSVYGDGNYVSNTMDNSIRQYGGDNRQFTYVSSGQGKYGGDHLETPASMATLGGFYDVDDSPSKQAKFTDLYSTLNRDAQKKYGNTSSIAQSAIYRAGMNSAVDRDNLDKRLFNREMYSRAKSDLLGMQTFGDMYGYTPPQYQMPDPQKPVKTPDFGELVDEYTDF